MKNMLYVWAPAEGSTFDRNKKPIYHWFQNNFDEIHILQSSNQALICRLQYITKMHFDMQQFLHLPCLHGLSGPGLKVLFSQLELQAVCWRGRGHSVISWLVFLQTYKVLKLIIIQTQYVPYSTLAFQIIFQFNFKEQIHRYTCISWTLF